MTPTLITYALFAAISVGLLAFFLTGLAVRHDQVVEAAPFTDEIAVLKRRSQEARDVLADINGQIDTRREAMERIAGDEAEVAALMRMRQEILDELNRLEERREEIRQMDRETEEAVARFAEAQRDLDQLENQLRLIQARLDRAEALTGNIADLEAQETRLMEDVSSLRAEVGELQRLQNQEGHLRANLEDLRREEARLEGTTRTATARLQEVSADVTASEGARAEAAQMLSTLQVERAAISLEVEKCSEERAALEARVAHLRDKAGQLDGTGSVEADPLRDLKVMPEVLQQLGALPPHDETNEQDALRRVKLTMEAHGLNYPDRTIHAFHTAMKVNDTTQMAVLAGISGTGKSQLPRRYAEGMGIGFLQVPVQPRWDSPQDLMGFYNYIENRYRPTEMAKALFHLDQFNGDAKDADLQDRMMMILLDEMNLARVEYYFSDFLSRLESRPPKGREQDPKNRTDASIELELRMPDGQNAPTIYPGYNLLFAGTMNEDESTQSLSDKVVDRANILRFAAPKTLKKQQEKGEVPVQKALTRTQWDNWRREPGALGRNTDQIGEQIEKLADIMRQLHRPIGHRMGVAMGAYVANYPELNGDSRISTPLADQVEMRLLPKLRGVEVETRGTQLRSLADLVEQNFEDAQLAAAIRLSLDASEETGQFIWRGVSRL